MVPTRIDGVPQGIAYLLSFSSGVLVMSYALLALYALGMYVVKRQIVQMHFRVAFIPGLAAGLLFSLGNVCAIYATQFLGLTIGFPLTQGALLVAGLWGMFYYKVCGE